MAKLVLLTLALSLGACMDRPPYQPTPSPCKAGEATYACQVERYHNVSAP